MLLIAAKSFIRQIPVKKVIIICDPSIIADDKKILLKHLVNVEFIDAADIDRNGLPKGGCWERIIAIAQHSSEGYIIQLDADTITTAMLDQVRYCVDNDIAFTLGTRLGPEFYDLSKSASIAQHLKSEGNDHIQLDCEALLPKLPNNYSQYVRGCAGFVGFPRGTLKVERLIEIGKFYSNHLGMSRWSEWGTEQFTSNLCIANIANKEVLNINEYNVPNSHFVPSVDLNNLRFKHYIGSIRYTSFNYMNTAMGFIKSISG
jgi:hypothetical protein